MLDKRAHRLDRHPVAEGLRVIHSEPGFVIECLREHFVFSVVGDVIPLQKGELLIVVEVLHSQGLAIRVETSEIVHVSLLELPVFHSDPVNKRTYNKVWP